jgi:hypothetical protein
MANQLKMAWFILTLHERAGPGGGSLMNSTWIAGRSRDTSSWQSRQARCGHNFKTRQGADRAGPGIGAFKTRHLFGRGRAATAEPWREIIDAKQAQGLSARRIHQDLVAEHGATVGYASVRRFLRRLGWVRPLPFRRIECSPGEEAQVDFGSVAPIVGPDGKRRRTHVFRVVLSHSRKAYSEATYRQSKYPARLAPNAGLLVHLSRKAVDTQSCDAIWQDISAGQR